MPNANQRDAGPNHEKQLPQKNAKDLAVGQKEKSVVAEPKRERPSWLPAQLDEAMLSPSEIAYYQAAERWHMARRENAELEYHIPTIWESY